MIVVEGERMRDRLEAILPTRSDRAISADEAAIWLNAPADHVRRALRILQNFRAVEMRMDKRRTGPRSNTTRMLWWAVR
jgi:hypothetical protein